STFPVAEYRFPPLPEGDDPDLSDFPMVSSTGLKALRKVAGARCKSPTHKSKKRARTPASEDDNVDTDADVSQPRKRGRPQGSANFRKDDVGRILSIVKRHQPMGGRGWEKVTKEYNMWAVKHSRPEREWKSLKNKFDSLVKTTKPTGDAECPPEVKEAKRIDQMISSKSGSHSVRDAPSASHSHAHCDGDASNTSSDDSIEFIENKTYTAIAHRAPTPPLTSRAPRLNAPALVNQLAQSFEPSAQAARDDQRARRSTESMQVFMLTQQVRDLNTTNEGLRNQLFALQGHLNDAKRAHDRSLIRLEMLGHGGGHQLSCTMAMSDIMQDPGMS
ncbi:hypothetical protein GGX14DRAFT_350570, partial [Mycena pura]